MQQFDMSVGDLIFSNAGEVDLHKDVRFEKLLNNSLGMSPEQFQFIGAVSAGQVTVNADGSMEALVDALDPDGFYLCQPPRRPTRNDPVGRQYILIYGVFPSRNKIRRIFVRKAGADKLDASSGLTLFDTLFKISRPAALLKEITIRMANTPILPVLRNLPDRKNKSVRKVYAAGPKQWPRRNEATAQLGAQFPKGMGEELKEKLHQGTASEVSDNRLKQSLTEDNVAYTLAVHDEPIETQDVTALVVAAQEMMNSDSQPPAGE